MLEGDAPAPWLAFKALSTRDDPAALSLLLEQANSVDPHRRRASIEAIGQSPVGGRAIERVREALDDPAPPVVDAAITAVGRLGDEASRARLRMFLANKKNQYLRGYALLALTEMWSDADFDAVIDVARRDSFGPNRKNAGFVLRTHPVRWRELVELWHASELPRERSWACELIGQYGEIQDSVILESLRRDPDGHVRQAAEEALIALERRASRS